MTTLLWTTTTYANKGFLVRSVPASDLNLPFVPGDAISHFQDSGAFGLIVACREPDGMLVIWSRLPFSRYRDPIVHLS